MSKYIDNIETLQNNVFTLTPLLVAFYRNLKKSDNNLLLAYFVFPIVLNKKCIGKLLHLKTNSNMIRITNNRELMAGFEDRFDYYKEITNRCLQYALDCKYIEIDEKLSVSVIANEHLQTDAGLKESFDVAKQLYKIFTKNVVNTYYSFGIKRL